jgi:Cu/Ag efflux protein CusF
MSRKGIASAVAAVIACLATGYTAYRYGIREGTHLAAPAPSATHVLPADKIDPATGRRVLYWHDPMVPEQKFDKPGRSPFMDMELVPVYADAAERMGGASPQDPAMSQVHQATGEIVALSSREILIRHGDLPGAGMGAMTMPFLISGAAIPPGLKQGDRIRFEFSVRPDAQYQIISIVPGGAGTPDRGAQR